MHEQKAGLLSQQATQNEQVMDLFTHTPEAAPAPSAPAAQPHAKQHDLPALAPAQPGRETPMNQNIAYQETTRGLFAQTPWYAHYDPACSSVRRHTGHPERGVYASELYGACLIQAERLNRLSRHKRWIAYQQAYKFAEAMNERHSDEQLERAIWDNWSKIDEALEHVRTLIAEGHMPFTQAARIVAKRYQQTITGAEQMIVRYPKARTWSN